MNKKMRWSLGVSSMVAVVAIVPATVVACSSDSTQSTVDNYVSQINGLKANTIVGKDTVLPSVLTSDNAATYLSGLPSTPSGVTLSFTFSKIDDATGTLDITISVTAKGATAKSTNVISVSGFLTSKSAVDSYIATIKAIPANTITGSDKILPSTLTSDNAATYLSGLPSTSSGVTLSFAFSKIDDAAGTVDITISVTATGTTTQSSDAIAVSGFLTSQTAVDNTFNAIKALPANTITGKNTILPSVLTDANVSQYLNNIPSVPTGVTLTYTVSNANDAAGTIDIVINVAAIGATTKSSSSISVGSFLTGTVAISSYINTINALPKGTITGNTTALPSGLISTNISQYLNNVPTAPQGLTITYSPVNGSNSKGTIDLTISVSVSGTTAQISNNIVVSGFGTYTTLTDSLVDGSVYANYWSATPSSSDLSTLTSSATSNSLYITGLASDVSPFDSSKVIPASGTTNISTYINLPVGLSSTDVTSWTMVGNNTTGIATFTLSLQNLASTTAVIKVSGFMTSAMAAQLSLLSLSTNISNHAGMVAPADGTVPLQSSNKAFSNVGIWGINWGQFDLKLFGGSASYVIQNSNPAEGTANWIMTFKNGVALSIPITGYKKVTASTSTSSTTDHTTSTTTIDKK